MCIDFICVGLHCQGQLGNGFGEDDELSTFAVLSVG